MSIHNVKPWRPQIPGYHVVRRSIVQFVLPAILVSFKRQRLLPLSSLLFRGQVVVLSDITHLVPHLEKLFVVVATYAPYPLL